MSNPEFLKFIMRESGKKLRVEVVQNPPPKPGAQEFKTDFRRLFVFEDFSLSDMATSDDIAKGNYVTLKVTMSSPQRIVHVDISDEDIEKAEKRDAMKARNKSRLRK